MYEKDDSVNVGWVGGPGKCKESTALSTYN